MTSGLHALLHLWTKQKRRDFSWRSFCVGLLLLFYFLLVVLILYFALSEHLGPLRLPFAVDALAPLLAVSVVPCDLLMKVFWRRSPVEMDDYLRTRPVTQHDWCLFILIDTAAGFMQWLLPLMMAFVAALLMSWWSALLTLLLTYSCTMVNALFQNVWRRAPGNQWTLPLVFAYLSWLVVLVALTVLGLTLLIMSTTDAVVYLGSEPPATSVSSATSIIALLLTSLALLLINAAVGRGLLWYFNNLRNHNEEQHAPVQVTARSLGEVSLWSIEWMQVMRSKRLRVSFLSLAIIFLINVYLQQLMPTMAEDFSLQVNPMLFFTIGFPSVVLAQWVLGVEANFFAGIWTRPWPVEDILCRKYIFFCIVCLLMALLCLPAVAFMLSWLAALLFACGIFVLPFMATALFSSRMDMFASAFFNYQSANKQINVFSFILFIPCIIYFGAYFLLPVRWADLSLCCLGLLGIALHKCYIHWVARLWFSRRYEIMERWMRE